MSGPWVRRSDQDGADQAGSIREGHHPSARVSEFQMPVSLYDRGAYQPAVRLAAPRLIRAGIDWVRVLGPIVDHTPFSEFPRPKSFAASTITIPSVQSPLDFRHVSAAFQAILQLFEADAAALPYALASVDS